MPMKRVIASKNSSGPSVSSSELFDAVVSGQLPVVRRFVEQGGSLNIRRKGDSTPLMYAISNADLKMASYLIEHGADVNASNDIGQTPLMIAATVGQKQIVEELVHAGANMKAVDQEGRTAIAWAASRGDFPEVISLLFTYGTAPDAPDKQGMTPLMRAAVLGFEKSVAMLLTIGADDAAKFGGKTAYQMATEKGLKRICDVMETVLKATSKERWRRKQKAW